MESVMSFFTDNVLTNPPVLLGLVAAIGLIVQRNNISEVIKGALQAAFGMLILDVGVGLIVETIAPINEAFQETIASDAMVTEALSDVTFTSDFGGEVGLAMFIGLILRLFYNFRYIFDWNKVYLISNFFWYIFCISLVIFWNNHVFDPIRICGKCFFFESSNW